MSLENTPLNACTFRLTCKMFHEELEAGTQSLDISVSNVDKIGSAVDVAYTLANDT